MFRPHSAKPLTNDQFRVDKDDFLAIQKEYPNIPIEKESKAEYLLYSIRVGREAFTYFSIGRDADADAVMNKSTQQLPGAPHIPTTTVEEDVFNAAVSRKADEIKIAEAARNIL